jgi:hypothetical protein
LWKAWENNKTVFPPFPQTLEIASQFPHSLRPAADNLYPILKTKRSLPRLPIPFPFRLIFQLEKTERKQIYLVTMTVPSSRKEVIAQVANGYRDFWQTLNPIFVGRLRTPGLKPSIYIPERSRGFKNPLPRTKVRGWHIRDWSALANPIQDCVLGYSQKELSKLADWPTLWRWFYWTS